jgi:hypothetical protein
VSAFVDSTADLDPEARASAVRRTMTAATAAGKPAGQIFTAGYLEANARAVGRDDERRSLRLSPID